MALRNWIMLFRMLRAEARARHAAPARPVARLVQWRHGGGSRPDGAAGAAERDQGWRSAAGIASRTPQPNLP